MGYRAQRVAENIKRELSFLIRSLKNQSVKKENLTVKQVEVSSDCSFVRVYIGSIKGVTDARCSVRFLNNAVGYFKREISNKLRLKKTPRIEFVLDDSEEYCKHLDEIFLKI